MVGILITLVELELLWIQFISNNNHFMFFSVTQELNQLRREVALWQIVD